MPLTVTDVSELQAYINGVLDRADHHAGNVNEVALAIAGAIVWKKDTNEPIKVMAQGGETKNVLWVYISGNRYAFSYNHQSGKIEIREGSTQGDVLQDFDNSSLLSEVKDFFSSL